MKRLFQKITVILLMAVMTFGYTYMPVKAADSASVSVSSATASTGGEVSITVKVTGSTTVLMTDLYLTYDSSVLEAVSGYDAGGGGSIRILSLESTSFTVKFKALAAGTSAISVNTGSSRISTASEDKVALSVSNGSVTVSAPVSYSSNNNLSSLQISPGTLSPAFSANVTSYTASVDADCSKLTVSAVTADSTATTKVTGTTMDPGSNTTTITVTAQNGSTKVYTIHTTKAGANAATTEATTAATSGTKYDDDAIATIDGINYRIINDFSKYSLPSGFVEEEFEYNTYNILTGKNATSNLTIMYLMKEDQTEDGAFYIYDTVTKKFTKMTVLTQPEYSYTVLAIDDSMEIPDGFSKSVATINGNNVDVLLPTDVATPNYYLFYGVDSKGKTSWYQYDTVEGTVQKYYETPNQGIAVDKSGNASVTDETKKWMVIAYVAIGIAAVLLVICIILATKKRKSSDYDLEDDYEDDDYEDKSIKDDILGDSDNTEDTTEYDADDIEEEDDFEFLEIEDVDDK